MYGTHSLFIARPAFIVFNTDRFDVAVANELARNEKLHLPRYEVCFYANAGSCMDDRATGRLDSTSEIGCSFRQPLTVRQTSKTFLRFTKRGHRSTVLMKLG